MLTRAVGKRTTSPSLGSTQSKEDVNDVGPADVCDTSDKYAFMSSPPPPMQLWDTDDLQFLDKVTCEVQLRITRIDPKCGAYEARMRVEWALRTLNSHERTEPRIRVPSIRIPLLATTVEESRVWRVDEAGSKKTHYWNGLTIMNLSGFEVFEVQDFPFDRQVIDLDLFDFVWRPEKDSAEYDVSLRVVSLSIRTTSMMPDWDTFPAVVTPLNVARQGSGPSNASRFKVQLRMQRKQQYFISQVFCVTYLITLASILPVALPPDMVNDRLALHGGGLLTLVAFKYAISEQLPSVPYTTFTDKYIMLQVIILVVLSVESVVSYKLSEDLGLVTKEDVNLYETILLLITVCFWTLCFLLAAFCWRRRSWEQVMAGQSEDVETQDDPKRAALRAERSSSRILYRE